jgi:hypothetical protein
LSAVLNFGLPYILPCCVNWTPGEMARNWFADPVTFLAPRNLNICRWIASIDEQTKDRGLSFIRRATALSSSPPRPPAATTACRYNRLSPPLPAVTTACRHHYLPLPPPVATTACRYHRLPLPLPAATTVCCRHRPPPPPPVAITACRHHRLLPPPPPLALPTPALQQRQDCGGLQCLCSLAAVALPWLARHPLALLPSPFCLRWPAQSICRALSRRRTPTQGWQYIRIRRIRINSTGLYSGMP